MHVYPNIKRYLFFSLCFSFKNSSNFFLISFKSSMTVFLLWGWWWWWSLCSIICIILQVSDSRGFFEWFSTDGQQRETLAGWQTWTCKSQDCYERAALVLTSLFHARLVSLCPCGSLGFSLSAFLSSLTPSLSLYIQTRKALSALPPLRLHCHMFIRSQDPNSSLISASQTCRGVYSSHRNSKTKVRQVISG